MSNQRTKVCGSKAKYQTETQAWAAAKAYTRKFHSAVRPYVCPFCGGWHYGHLTQPTKQTNTNL